MIKKTLLIGLVSSIFILTGCAEKNNTENVGLKKVSQEEKFIKIIEITEFAVYNKNMKVCAKFME